MEIKSRFMIERNAPAVVALLEKYQDVTDKYVMSEEEQTVFGIVSKLSEFERICWYAYSENHSIHKLAQFFGIRDRVARSTIEDLKERIKGIMYPPTPTPAPADKPKRKYTRRATTTKKPRTKKTAKTAKNNG